MVQEFYERINLKTDLSKLAEIICQKYYLGEYISEEIILVGYEDFNFILTTNKGKYCVKVFNKDRTFEDVNMYIDRIKLANTLKVNTPKVYECNRDMLCEIKLDDVNFRLCVFKYIDGKSFYDLGIIPNSNEIKEIIRQMAIIHKATLQSDFIYDKWAIINFVKEFQDKKQHLNENDYKKLDELYNRFLQVDIEKLPKAFVHGDIISTNVMKDKNNKLWIIDFAVSNYVPRIIDLAVSSCNLCLDAENKENTKKKVKMILEEYQKYNNKCFIKNYKRLY